MLRSLEGSDQIKLMNKSGYNSEEALGICKELLSIYQGILEPPEPTGSSDRKALEKRRKRAIAPPCTCQRCLTQYRSMKEQEHPLLCYDETLRDINSAQKLAQSAVQGAAFELRSLIKAVQAYGDTILKRWLVSQEARESYLKAVPDIYGSSSPSIELMASFRRNPNTTNLREFPSAYLTPYMNREWLCKDPARFLSLLWNRLTSSSMELVSLDDWEIQSAWDSGMIPVDWAPGCISMDGDEYGTVKDFNADLVHQKRAYGSPRGLIILMSQAFLAEILAKVVNTILHHVEAVQSPTIETIHPVLSDTREYRQLEHYIYNSSVAFNSGSSYGWMWRNRPFSKPGTNRSPALQLLEIIKSRADEARDVLELLQTDINHFFETVKYHNSQLIYKIKVGSKKRERASRERLDSVGYAVTIQRMTRWRKWQWALEECRIVCDEMQAPRDDAAEQTPHRLQQALANLYQVLSIPAEGFRSELGQLLISSPHFQQSFRVKKTPDTSFVGRTLLVEIEDQVGTDLMRTDRLAWCLWGLFRGDEGIDHYDGPTVFQHLDKILEASDVARGRVDDEMHRCLSDLMTVYQIQTILELDFPPFEKKEFIADFLGGTRPWQAMYSGMAGLRPNLIAELSLGSHVSPSYFCPPKGSRDEQWLTERDRALKKVNTIWECARDRYEKIMTSGGVPQWCLDSQLQQMNLGKSPENLRRLEVERSQILARVKETGKHKVTAERNLLEDILPSFRADTEPKYRVPEPLPTKIKTRPDAKGPGAEDCTDPPDHNAAAASSDSPEPERRGALYTFAHRSKTMKVIRAIFPSPEDYVADISRTASWQDFAAAFTNLGFLAEPRGGSVYRCSGNIKVYDHDEPQRHSIAIHKPHRDTEMSAFDLRDIGHRCNRRFGWERASFGCVGKQVRGGHDCQIRTGLRKGGERRWDVDDYF